jgi:hypothetical protein
MWVEVLGLSLVTSQLMLNSHQRTVKSNSGARGDGETLVAFPPATGSSALHAELFNALTGWSLFLVLNSQRVGSETKEIQEQFFNRRSELTHTQAGF